MVAPNIYDSFTGYHQKWPLGAVLDQIGNPNGWCIIKSPIKMDDKWGSPISGHLHLRDI